MYELQAIDFQRIWIQSILINFKIKEYLLMKEKVFHEFRVCSFIHQIFIEALLNASPCEFAEAQLSVS